MIFFIKIPGKCDQRCKNLEGSYECGCEPGYNIRPDNHTCQAYNEPDPYELPSLIYANSINVKRAYLETDESSRDVKMKGRYFSPDSSYPHIITFLLHLSRYHMSLIFRLASSDHT